MFWSFNQQNSMKKFVTSIQLNVKPSPLINKPTFPSNLLQETEHDRRSESGNPIGVQQRLNEKQKDYKITGCDGDDGESLNDCDGVISSRESEWSAVEDQDLITDAEIPEKSNYWEEIETRMGLDVDDLALIMNLQDFVSPASSVEVINEVGIVMPNEHHSLPPPLPSCSPPPLETPPNERATSGTERKPDHSSSPARRPDFTSVDKAFRGITVNSQRQWRNDSILSNYMLNPIETCQSIPSENVNNSNSNIDRISQKFDGGFDATNNKQRIDDSSFEMQPSTFDRYDCNANNNSVFQQLDNKERELLAKENEVDRLSQEMRRWQREAVALNEEKSRLSALLNSALRELKALKDLSMPLKSPNYSPSWLNKPTPAAPISSVKLRLPVNLRHSFGSEKDLEWGPKSLFRSSATWSDRGSKPSSGCTTPTGPCSITRNSRLQSSLPRNTGFPSSSAQNYYNGK